MRLSRTCPTCGPRSPVTLTLVPNGIDPSQVSWMVACNSCGYEFPAVQEELVTDGVAWGKAKRAAGGGRIVDPSKI